MEKLEALMKDQATPENVLDDLIEKPTKENILQEKYFKDLKLQHQKNIKLLTYLILYLEFQL